MSEVIRAVFEASQLELRFLGDGSQRKLVGYACPFDSGSRDMGGWKEIVRRGAFARSLATSDDIIATVDHDPTRLLGRRSSRTLRLTEDQRGLSFEVDPPDTSYAKDLTELVRRGDVVGCSFSFTVSKTGRSWKKEGEQRWRELTDVTLHEVSVLTGITCAYPATEVMLRSHQADTSREWEAEQQYAERRLRLAEARARL